MRFVLAALVLIAAQQFAWREPTLQHDSGTPRPIESLLRDATTTSDAIRLVGKVVDAAPSADSGVRLTVSVESANDESVSGLVNVSLRTTSRRWRTGDRLALRSRLRRITGFGNFGELDWAAYSARRGIFATAYAWRDEDVEVLPADDGLVDRLRRRFSEACEQARGQGAEILEALIIGDRTGIDRQTSDAVRDAGLAHFLAISGSHMALIVAIVVGLVRGAAGLRPALLERYDVLRAAAVVAALAVVAYGAVCGGGVSVARSEIMALAAMVALWHGRPGDEWRALGGSAIVLALAMPGVGEEAGFQLSYLAVAALVLDSQRRRIEARTAAPPAAQAGPQHPAKGPSTSYSSKAMAAPAGPPTRGENLQNLASAAAHLLLEAARLTVVCWLVTSPVVAHHFQRVSLVAPLANLLAAPFVSAIVIFGIAGLALLPIAPAAGQLGVQIGALLSSAVIRISEWCAALPMAATTTPAPGVALTAAMTALALVALLPRSRRKNRSTAALATTAAVLVAVALYDRYRTDRLDVWFASVGQGDAAILRMPGGKVWVIDEGPPGRGRMVVGPLLRRAWIGRVDVLVASHIQSDHAGAMTEILEDFDVGEIWFPDGPCDVPAARAIQAAAKARGVPVRFVSDAGARDATQVEAAARNATTTVGADTNVTSVAADADARAAVITVNTDNIADTNEAESSSGATIQILSPPPGSEPCNSNDQSIVMKIAFAGRSVLFTGDIEARTEEQIADIPDAKSDVLKVPHHGSRTSSTEALLRTVSPTLAVASLGLDNQFHFPAPEVVERYERLGVQFLRTDRTGAVHLTIDADGAIDIETFHDAQGKAW